jgi:hypothetical protein
MNRGAMQTQTRRLLVTATVVVVVALSAVGASAHPGSPWRSVVWARQTEFGPNNTGPYRTVKAACAGIPPSSRGLYRHFQCVTTRKDGERFSVVIHSEIDGTWTFSDVRHVGPGPSNQTRVIGSASGSGDYAAALASGTVKRPYTIKIVATASPDQQIDVTWDVVCVKTGAGGGIGSGSKSGSYSDFSGPAHVITLPMASPDSCTVGASASLNGLGSVKVSIVVIIQY